MKKRVLTVLLAIALMASLCTGAAFGYAEEYEGYNPEAQQQYSDVPAKHWAFESIATCSQRDWFNGYPDGTFKPGNQIRRDEAAKVFAVALALPIEKSPTISFTDTGSNWAKSYIEATKNLFPNTTTLAGTSAFRPEQTITREETIYALVVAWRYVSETTNADLSVLNMFSDKNSVSEAVKPYAAVAVSKGLISGIPDGKGGSTIQGQTGLSRAEFATMLARALKMGIGDEDTSTPVITLNTYSSTTPDATVTVSGTVKGDCQSLTCGGKTIAVNSNGAFSVELPLVEGANSFTLTATNIYKVSGTATINITRNSTKPSIRLLSTIPSETAQSSVSANGKINAWSDDCTLLLDNTRVQVDSEGLFEVKLTLKDGVNNFKLEVVQKGVTVTSQTITITKLTTVGAGEWLDALPGGVTAENYNIEEKTQYRTQTREVKTSTEDAMSGWTLVTKGGNWGGWSGWQDNAVSASATREVETQNVRAVEAHTEYRYHYYQNNAGVRHFCPYYAGYKYESNYNGGTFKLQYTDWQTSQATLAVDNFIHVNQGAACTRSGCADGGGTVRAYTLSGGYSESNRVFYEESRYVPASDKTQYRYRDYTGSNVFEKWSDWSSWSDTAAKEETNTKVETKTMYRFTVK